MDTFGRLSPRLRHGIIDTLRWSGLRRVQQDSIPVVLDGHNAVIIAPTAGGKTEAAFLPCLDVLGREGGTGVGLLYVSPLIALLNNQEERASRLADLVGLQAFKWHGGVGASARRRFLGDPASVLLTTPESLEAMLLGRSIPVRDLFRELRFVVVDEVHAFAASDRGAHLIAVIERLSRFSRHDVQRIGLSATVANPAVIGGWLKGRSARSGRVVRPNEPARFRQASVLAVSDKRAGLELLVELTRVGKTLIFTEGRADAERVADHLHQAGQLQFVGTYHSAISRDARQQAEDAMTGRERQRVALACTSAMELGIDLGDLDDVLQWGAPPNISSLLQRWGRSGRRAGREQHTTILTFTAWEALTVAAQLSLAEEGKVEAVQPHGRAFHILLQQIVAEILHSGRHNSDSLWAELRGIPAFRDITEAEYRALLSHLLKQDLLAQVGGQLTLGDKGERRFAAKHFQAIITSFETPEVYTVLDTSNHFEVGQIEEFFVDQLRDDLGSEGSGPVLLLGGRAWQVLAILDATGVVTVKPDRSGKPPKWQGGAPRMVSFELAWRHRELLLGHRLPAGLDGLAVQQIHELCSQYAILAESRLPVRQIGKTLTCYTFAGTRINYTLELLLREHGKTQSDPFTVRVELVDELEGEAARKTLDRARQGFSAERRAVLVARQRPLRLSKYQAFLPADQSTRLVADAMLDEPGTVALLDRHLPVPQSTADSEKVLAD